MNVYHRRLPGSTYEPFLVSRAVNYYRGRTGRPFCDSVRDTCVRFIFFIFFFCPFQNVEFHDNMSFSAESCLSDARGYRV